MEIKGAKINTRRVVEIRAEVTAEVRRLRASRENRTRGIEKQFRLHCSVSPPSRRI